MTRSKIVKLVVQILLVLMIFATVAFIWNNSLKSKAQSTQQSRAVTQTVRKAVEGEQAKPYWKEDTSPVLRFFTNNIRKIAHWVEFSVLALELGILALSVFGRRRLRGYLVAFGLTFAVAAIDETLQLLSDRGALVTDVLLDTAAGAVALGLLCLIVFLVGKIDRHFKKTKEVEE